MSEKNGHIWSQRDIADCNAYIEEIKSAVEIVGQRLTEIRDRKLYLIYSDTFEEFGQKVLKRSRSWLYNQIEMEEVKEGLPDKMSKFVDTYSKAQELQKVPQKRRMGVIARVLESEKNVTPQTIREAAREERKPAQMPPEEPIDVKEVVYDATGYEVPEHLVEFYQQGKEFGKEMLTRVSSLRGALRRADGDKDPRFAFISISTTMRQLDSVYAELTMLTPYVVCPNCQGQVKSHCVLCRTTGFIPEHVWKTAVDSQTKAVRQRGIDQKKKK